MHNGEDQKKRITQWCQRFFDEMMSRNSKEKRHAERTKLNVNRAQNENIRYWIIGASQMKR